MVARRARAEVRRRGTRAGVALVALALGVSGCGSKSAGERALSNTASRLGRVRSGSLTMRVAATMPGRPAEPVGYALTGPFQLAAPGGLPLARLDYTRLAGPRQAVVRVVVDGHNAWVVADGTTRPLPPDQVEQLRASGSGASGGAVAGVHLTHWLRHPRVEPADAGVDRITGDVDAGAALADMLSLSARYGANTTALTKTDVDVLRRAARHAQVELLTGHADRFLRRLSLDVDFAAAANATLARALGQSAGPHLSIELAIADPNQPVHIDS